MSFKVASLPATLSGMVANFNVAPATIAAGIVPYGMAIAGLVMLVVLFGVAHLLMHPARPPVW